MFLALSLIMHFWNVGGFVIGWIGIDLSEGFAAESSTARDGTGSRTAGEQSR